VRALVVILFVLGCSAEVSGPDGGADAARLDALIPDTATADGAVDPLLALDACADGVLASLTLEHIAPLARDTDSYRPPTAGTRDALSQAIDALALARFGSAVDHATGAGYVICRGVGDEAGLVLVRPAAATGNAWLALRLAGATREIVIEAPHPIWDADTEVEAVELFARTDARAVLIAGTHRCASDRTSGCTGTADACGIDALVRESDMAHAIDSTFHAAHGVLALAYPDAWFVAVHGFEGPGASVSDGTNDPTSATSRSARLAIALRTRFGDDVTTCNDFGDASITTEERVCGTDDVQGRLLNGSPAECTAAGSEASDRFVHLEQAPEYRPERTAEVAAAVLEAFEPR
jgi:hypothetical protein